jgi:hypothetical protein
MDIRIFILIGIVGFNLAGIANAIYFGLQLKRYAERTHVLDSALAMLRFKKIVANQMYAALAQIALLIAPPALFFLGVFLDVLNASDIFWVIGPAIVVIVVAMVFRSWEQMAKSIPASDPEIEEQRNAVIRTWMRKPLPNW